MPPSRLLCRPLVFYAALSSSNSGVAQRIPDVNVTARTIQFQRLFFATLIYTNDNNVMLDWEYRDYKASLSGYTNDGIMFPI
jgi:hypothetical protein